eukprot:3995000-Prymnesium_polylepis.1
MTSFIRLSSTIRREAASAAGKRAAHARAAHARAVALMHGRASARPAGMCGRASGSGRAARGDAHLRSPPRRSAT